MTSPKSLNLQSEYITHSSDQGLAVGDAGKDSIVSSVLRCSLVGKSNTTQIKRHTHYDQIDQRLYKWMRAQHMFFVGTGPVPGCGAPNCSPKGLAGTVAVINSNTIAYLDSYGSGIETIAHLEQTGSNICIMMVAFEGTPLVLRLHGRGRVVLRQRDAEYDELKHVFQPAAPSTLNDYRAIVIVTCDRIFDSCGYGVPKYTFNGYRTTLTKKLSVVTSGKIHPVTKVDILDDVKMLNAKSVDGYDGPYPNHKLHDGDAKNMPTDPPTSKNLNSNTAGSSTTPTQARAGVMQTQSSSYKPASKYHAGHLLLAAAAVLTVSIQGTSK